MIKLTIAGRPTHSADLLRAGLGAEGVTPTRRKGGWSDYQVIQNLVRTGWMTPRSVGPRGGIRYFTTDAGSVALTIGK